MEACSKYLLILLLEHPEFFLLMTLKGQEEDNRHQLSKITKGAIFTVIYHCLLLGGLAFLVCVLSPTARTSLKVPSVVSLESLVWALGEARASLWQGDSSTAEQVKLEKED